MSAQIDLNTVLLTIVLALAAWILHGVHQLHVSNGRIQDRVWGTDGKGGHDAEIKKLKTDFVAIQLAIVNIQTVLNMKRRKGELPAFDLLEEVAE